MKHNPYKSFNVKSLIPKSMDRMYRRNSVDITYKAKLCSMLKELGVG